MCRAGCKMAGVGAQAGLGRLQEALGVATEGRRTGRRTSFEADGMLDCFGNGHGCDCVLTWITTAPAMTLDAVAGRQLSRAKARSSSRCGSAKAFTTRPHVSLQSTVSSSCVASKGASVRRYPGLQTLTGFACAKSWIQGSNHLTQQSSWLQLALATTARPTVATDLFLSLLHPLCTSSLHD